jgi:hypothetical protein
MAVLFSALVLELLLNGGFSYGAERMLRGGIEKLRAH